MTEDWLNSLTDENGNKIIPEKKNTKSGHIAQDTEGDAMQRKIFNGQNSGDQFGYSVSPAGDVNGNGYSDVIVGAYGYSIFTGREYIYFGGMNMNTVADVTMTGETTNNNFGISVSPAGDVNGDGYSDVIVGAYGNSSNTGRAYVYFGGATMNNSADVTMSGESTSNIFGVSVSSAGDVNGDGYSDMIVGAYGFSTFTGRAYIYMGSAISAKPVFVYVKDVPNDQGGFVDLKWARSSYDVNGSDIITHYVVERRFLRLAEILPG